MKSSYEKLFSLLDEALKSFIEEVDRKKLTDRATEEWSVKDLLGHITFWHMYYAQQYEKLENGKEPFVYKTLAGKNDEGAKKMRYKSKREITKSLLKAHKTLKNSIVNKKIPKMRYMASREYDTDKFLEVITGHVQRHTLQVRRAKQM